MKKPGNASPSRRCWPGLSSSFILVLILRPIISIYITFAPPGTTIALAGLWLLCLLALDVLLYSFKGRRPLRALKWYWGACAVLVAALCLLNELIAFGVMTFGITSRPLLVALMAFVALLSRITPFPQMQLASYLLFKTELDLSEKIVYMGGIALTLLLIGGHFLWLRRLERRAAEEAERTST